MVGFYRMKTNMSHIKRVLLIGTALLPLLFLALATKGLQPWPGAAHLFTADLASENGPVPETAHTAYDFVNSIGVNTHLNYFDRIYGNFPLVERELRSIGIRHLRDGIHLQNADYNSALYGRWMQLGKLGIRFDAVLDPRSNLGPLTPALLENVDQLSGRTIESFEGPNELDISGMPDWISVDQNYQREISEAAKPLHDASQIRLIGPSLASASHGSELGSYGNSMDEGNLHSYPAAKMPSAVFPEQTDLAKVMFGDRKVVITESGYHNALNDHHDQPGISESAAAKYIPRLFLEDFARSIPRTYLYEFMDEAPDPALTNNQMHWGLIRADGSEKPAFLALKRLIEELTDSTEPNQTMQLAWSISPAVESIHHLLLQKSSGEFDLVLWQEISSYNFRSQTDIANAHVTALLTLGQRARSIVIFEPSMQLGPVKSFTDSTSVTLAIPDHPLVVRITMN
jgi:hypothetical protein